MPQLRLNQTKISPNSRRPASFFEPIPCASLASVKRVLVHQKEQEAGAGDARRCVGSGESITMVENTRPAQTRDPFDRFDEAISDPRLYEADQSRYEQLRAQLRYEPQHEPQPQYEQQSAPIRPAGMSSPMSCRMSGPRRCMRSGCHTSRFRCSSPATRKNPISRFPNTPSRAATSSGKKVRAARIVTAVVAVSAIGGLLALFSIDSTRAVIVNASLGGGAPGQFGAAAQ